MDYNVLLWVFFVSQGIQDQADMMRCQMLCMEVANMKDATVEKVKQTSGYKSCIYDIPDVLISDEKIQEMIDFEI